MSSSDIGAEATSSSPHETTTTTTWEECVGPAKWIHEPLQRILSYPTPLPVQQAVIPTITRALLSGVPNDVSLTAPTGSGKTLCYLLPLLRLLTETKRGVDDNALRCLILVPSQSLGQQVHRELQRLTRPTSIRVVCICGEGGGEAAAVVDRRAAAEADAAEAAALVRRVVLPCCAAVSTTTTHKNNTASSLSASGSSFGALAPGGPDTSYAGIGGGNEDDYEDINASDSASDGFGSDVSSSEEDGEEDALDLDVAGTTGSALSARTPSAHARPQRGQKVRYFSNADVVVATPQRLLHHLDHTRGLRLADLRLFVIDEADQVLVGNFASQVQKVNARYEYEVAQQARAQQRRQRRMSAALAARMTAVGDAFSLSSAALPSSFLPLHGGGARSGAGAATLHKVLCSATLSSRIARISQVKLRNCSYYVLDSNGQERQEEATVMLDAAAAAAAGGSSKRKKRDGGGAAGAAASLMAVRTQFALPPTLQEHVIFVEDAYRPAVLLKLVHALRERIAAVQRQQRRAQAARQAALEAPYRDEGDVTKPKTDTAAAAAAVTDYPSVEDRAGTSVLIFCATAEEARVMSHFLAAAGVTSVVEFTTLASESERRRALLQRPTDPNDSLHVDVSGQGGSAAAATVPGGADEVTCVVASDALMRGIDIPNVGHVIMYHPPDAVSQYVHRAGRTARAMRPGHVHLLLSKTGPSGTQEDGEMALFKRLSQSLSRTLPVSYERQFFRFAENPARPATPAPPATTTATAAAPAASTGATVGTAPSTASSDGVSSAIGATASTAAGRTPAAAAASAKTSPAMGSAEWWVALSEQFIAQSQHQLQRRWASVLESAAAVAAATAGVQKASATTAVGTGAKEGAKNSSPVSSVNSTASAARTGTPAARKRTRSETSKASAAH